MGLGTTRLLGLTQGPGGSTKTQGLPGHTVPAAPGPLHAGEPQAPLPPAPGEALVQGSGAAGAHSRAGERSRSRLSTSPSTAPAGVSALSPLGPLKLEVLRDGAGTAGRGVQLPSPVRCAGWGGSSRTTSRHCPLREFQGTVPWSSWPQAPGGTGPLHKCSLKREVRLKDGGSASLSPSCPEQR